MSLKKFMSALKEELPVLFVYIGWTDHYNGKEPVYSPHGFIKKNPYNNSEVRAFEKDPENELFCCGIGRGNALSRIHIVFLACDPYRKFKRIVGVYAAAEIELREIGNTSVPWADAYTKNAVRIAIDRRPKVTGWKKGQRQRRWALRPLGTTHPKLYKEFIELKKNLPKLLENLPQDRGEDQTYTDLEAREGQQRKALVIHRHREATFRQKKINDVLIKHGRLLCEVPNCRFDFHVCYGEIGRYYAHVHHRKPLSKAGRSGRTTLLKDLAIVCANCHSMIHRGGECREMKNLIPATRFKRLQRQPDTN